MVTINKKNYEAPSTTVIEVKSRGIICSSPKYRSFGDEEEMG